MDVPDALKLTAAPSSVAPFLVNVTLLMIVKPEFGPAATAPPNTALLFSNIEFMIVAFNALMSIAPPVCVPVRLVMLFPMNIE